MTITASQIMTQVRRLIGEVPGDDEDVWTDESAAASPTTDISDLALFQHVVYAQRGLVPRLKAMAVPQCVVRFDGPFPGAPPRAVRPLLDRIYRQSGRVQAGGPTYDPAGFRYGQAATGSTVYLFVSTRYALFTEFGCDAMPGAAEGSEVVLYDGSGSEKARAAVMDDGSPTTAILVQPLAVTPGETLTVKIEGTATDLHVWLTGATSPADDGLVALFRNPTANRRMTASGRTPTRDFPVFTWESGRVAIYPAGNDGGTVAYFLAAPPDLHPDSLLLGNDALVTDERLAGALAFTVAARVLEGYERGDEAKAFTALAEDEMSPFGYGLRSGPWADSEDLTETV